MALDDLVQESEKLLMDVQEDNDLPYITRSLDQIWNFGEKLFLLRGPRNDVKAARLLGSKMSYEIPAHLSSKLEALGAMEQVETLTLSPDIDIHTFLKTEREDALLNIIHMAQNFVSEEAEARCDHSIQNWWEQEATGVLSSLAGSAGPLDTDLSSHPINFDSLAQDDHKQTTMNSSSLSREELCYLNQLDHYLDEHLASTPDIGSTLLVEQSSNLLIYLAQSQDSHHGNRIHTAPLANHSDVLEIWNLLRRIQTKLCDEQLVTAPRSERSSGLRASKVLQETLIDCSLDHLESEFAEFLRVTVASQPSSAKLGGRPGTRQLVRAYLSLRLSNATPNNSSANPFAVSEQNNFGFEDGFIDSQPVWPMIFYCLRAGDPQAAVQIAEEAVNNLGHFSQILAKYIENNRCPGTQLRFKQTCRQIIKSSRDPYKRLVYSIIGQCDPNDNHSDVVNSIDDFLWVKLSLVVGQDTSDLSRSANYEEVPSLAQLQTLLYETYGEVHFDAWSQPLVFFKILCLTQQFEAAIAFLSRFEPLRCHAVHVALVLLNMGLLLLPESIHSPLLSRNETDPTGFRRLNMARLIMLYTRKFEITDPSKALVYFYFLSSIPCNSSIDSNQTTLKSPTEHVLPSGKNSNLFTNCVCELALATKEFDVLLGTMTDSGFRKPGAIDRYCKTPESKQALICAVAQAVESRGQIIEAVILYQLASTCGNPKRHLLSAVSLINGLLASVIAVDCSGPAPQGLSRPTSGQSDRSLILQIATELAHKVRQSGITDDDGSGEKSIRPIDDAQSTMNGQIKTLFYLLDLAAFFDLVQAERWQAAIYHMDELGLFPTHSQSGHVESRVSLFSRLPDLVRRPLPWALFALMRCLTAKSMKETPSGAPTLTDGTSKLTLPEIRSRSRALIAYVGRIPYRLPSEIYARLTQMDMEIT